MCQSVWSYLGCPNRSTPLCRSTSWFANSTIALVRMGRSGTGSRGVLVSAGAAEFAYGGVALQGVAESVRTGEALTEVRGNHNARVVDSDAPVMRMAYRVTMRATTDRFRLRGRLPPGRWCRRGSGRGVGKRRGSGGGEPHDDGVAFTSGGSWRKLRFDGGYVEHWRADSVSPYGPARMCSPHRRVLGSRLPAAAFDRGRPKERGTVSPRTHMRAARWTTARRDGSGGSNRSVVADIGRGGTGEALRARRWRRIEGTRER